MIRAVLFDLDGTLYRQAPMRLLMAGELATVPWLRRHPRGVPRLWKQLRAFRETREALRALGRPAELLERLQYSVPAERSGMPPTEIEEAVAEWMFRRPLKYLRHVARPGLHELFERLDGQGLKIGVFSDYPVRDKLEALDVAGRVSLMLEATAPEINAFKPHPQGFSRACGRWALDPHEVLYVGDRPEVDAVGAARAGMPCAIIGAASTAGPGARFTRIDGMASVLGLIQASATNEEPYL